MARKARPISVLAIEQFEADHGHAQASIGSQNFWSSSPSPIGIRRGKG
jgi:hypothetical protein